jgi:chorismate mutase-like protein
MTDQSPKPAPDLAALRQEIDRIDAQMHELLIERSQIIETLIEVKKTAASGSAFRPAREADMMRRIVGRHRGLLPLDTVESIWRVIISTFTYVQAPYAVHADLTAGDAAMRDSARFHFGFTVPFVPHMGARAVITAVAASRGDLGLVPASGALGRDEWWTSLEGEGAPKVIARLPFVEREDHPAALPVFVVSKPIADAAVTDVELWSVQVAGWSGAAARAVSAMADLVVAGDRALDGASLLVSTAPGGIEAVLQTIRGCGASVRHTALVGSHASRYTVAARA